MTPFTNIHTHSAAANDRFAVLNLFMNVAEIERYPAVSIGIHPWKIKEADVNADLELLRIHAAHPHVKAIGECGLDRLTETEMDLQKRVFIEQVKIAEAVRKPLIIHCVRAFDTLIQVKKEERISVPLIVHGYNNNAVVAEQLLKHDIYLSFGKALLQAHSNASQLIGKLDASHFFLETDDADMAITGIFERAATLMNVDVEMLKQKMMNNFKQVLKYE